jgi:SWI/SNF related-matrix-associated actin-dependent regulator of chromatin subfamily C
MNNDYHDHYQLPVTKRKPQIRAKDFDSPGYLARIESIVTKINQQQQQHNNNNNTNTNTNIDVKQAIDGLIELIQANDECLGLKSLVLNRTMMKIPITFFTDDLKATGSLYRILSSAFDAKLKHNWRNFSCLSDQRKRELVEDVYKKAERELKSFGFMKHKKVYIPPTMRQYLKRAVNKTRVAVANKKNEPGVTHIIEIPHDQDEISSMKARGGEFTRAVRIDHLETLVHYSYHPDSYDAWVSHVNAPPYSGDFSDAIPKNGKAWVVNPLWLLDSASFNEWMNELDYRVIKPTTETTLDEQEELEQKQKQGELNNNNKKADSTTQEHLDFLANEEKKKKEIDVNTSLGMEQLSERATERLNFKVTRQYVVDQHPFIKASADFDKEKCAENNNGGNTRADDPYMIQLKKKICLENISHGQLSSGAFPSFAELKKNDDVHDDAPDGERRYRIPTHCSIWFKWLETSEVEKRALPDFFLRSHGLNSNEKMYITLRNSIVNAYKALQPGILLTMERACETCKKVEGNEMKVKRVFSFLERWNLINWPWSKGIMRNVPESFHVKNSLVLPSSPSSDFLEKLRQLERKPAFEHDPLILANPKFLEVKRNFSTCSQKQLLKLKVIKEIKCTACELSLNEEDSFGVEAKKRYFHLIDGFDCDLCERCFTDGRFPEGVVADKFERFDVRFDKTRSGDESLLNNNKNNNENLDENEENLIQIGFEDWSETELVALLEALENYGIGNWKEVSDFVQSRTAEDCIRAFAALPIQDGVLNDLMKQRTIAPRGVAIDHLSLLGDERKKVENESSHDSDFCATNFEVCNPVLARISFLSTMLSPRIASIAAREAMLKLLENKVNADEEISEREFTDSANALIKVAIVAVKNAAIAEETELERLSSSIAESRLRKCQLKLNQFELLENAFQNEQKIMSEKRMESKRETATFKTAVEKQRESVNRLTEHEEKIIEQMRLGLKETNA